MAKWLTHSPATLEVTGSRPTFGGISEIHMSNRDSPALRDLKGLCGIAELTVTCNVSGDNW